MWIVKENNKDAVLVGSREWNNCRFDTFAAAVSYANAWLGHWSPGPSDLKIQCALGNKYYYNGNSHLHGDFIQILDEDVHGSEWPPTP